MKQKYDFQPEALQSEHLAQVKAGDVLVLRPQPAEPATDDNATPTQPEQLGCYLLSGQPEQLVGLAPAALKHLKGYGELQASVRSVKRDAQGQVQQLMLRVEIREDGPITFAKPAPDPEPSQQLPEYVTHDDGFQLRRPQLEQLVHSPDIRHQLTDPRLQQLLQQIDGSKNREQALTVALEQPDFQQFSEQVLKLLDAGLPSKA